MKNKVPVHINKYYALRDQVERALQNIDFVHKKAQLAGEAVILNKGPDALLQREHQLAYAKAASDVYFSAAKKYFHVDKGVAKGKDRVHDALLEAAYSGINEDFMVDMLEQHKQEMVTDSNTFAKAIHPEIMKSIRGRLSGVPHAHLTDAHIADILKYTGLDDIIDGSRVRVREVVPLLDVYKSNGVVGKKILNQLFPDYVMKKPDYRSDYVGSKAA